MQDSSGKHVVAAIRAMGYELGIALNDDDTATVTARNPESGERFVCRAPGDGYAAVREVAVMVGVDLDR